MNAIIAFSPPIPPDDLQAIQAMLAEERILSSIFTPEKFDPYDLTSFIGQKEIYGNDFYALLDRNIFTRVVALARGKSISEKSKDAQKAFRLAAGALAFLQCCDVLIEPGVPFYEQAHQESPFSIAIEELRLFRRADSLHPKYFANIAVGRDACLDKKLIESITSMPDDERDSLVTPNWWLLNYALTLKLALLEQSQMKQREKLEAFLQWIHEDFTWLSPSVFFAVMYLGQKRKRGMLKRLRSQDRLQALKGVKNATWDLTLLTMWCSECGQKHGRNKIGLLCSRDEVVQEIGSSLMTTNNDSEQMCRQLFVNHWGEKEGPSLYRYYRDLAQKVSDPIRRIKQISTGDPFWMEAFKPLEREFLQSKQPS